MIFAVFVIFAMIMVTVLAQEECIANQDSVSSWVLNHHCILWYILLFQQCQPDGSQGICCSEFCLKQPRWAAGVCKDRTWFGYRSCNQSFFRLCSCGWTGLHRFFFVSNIRRFFLLFFYLQIQCFLLKINLHKKYWFEKKWTFYFFVRVSLSGFTVFKTVFESNKLLTSNVSEV